MLFFLYSFKNKTHDAGMSILDIGLLTGFTADTNDLKLVRTLHRYIHTCTVRSIYISKSFGFLIVYQKNIHVSVK